MIIIVGSDRVKSMDKQYNQNDVHFIICMKKKLVNLADNVIIFQVSTSELQSMFSTILHFCTENK